ncbi:hypothetical protein GP475_10405 [Corynebacterium poyangense]|uniref:Abi-like protein n=1 Tax=Corynebacterium poyangense TaxID=2684405 RepID=A0A7H0SR21_9CORY|nr:Abi family protein [Corynebacterium poyangense]QNQ90996.1 hypothetical protein GP475_10405 [Corynebacterium poyangense]
MNYSSTAVARHLSNARLAPYLQHTDDELDKALELYVWSTRMSMSMFELISHLEIMLRNAIDTALSKTFRDEDCGIPWFLRNPPTTQNMSDEIDDVRNRLRKYDKDTRQQIIAGMNFGFWSGMVGAKHEDLWRSALHKAFPGSSGDRKDVMKELESLRKIRNRIAHHDSMLNVDVPFEIRRIHRVAEFLGDEASAWLKNVDQTMKIYKKRPQTQLDTVIVPAEQAWQFYQSACAYVCQPGRAFRDVERIAFYSDQAVQSDVPKIRHRRDNVKWTKQEADRLQQSQNREDRQIAKVIRKSHEIGWADSGEYQVFLLTRPGSRDHRKLSGSIPNQNKGRESAFTHKQRYVSLHKLETASSIEDIV